MGRVSSYGSGLRDVRDGVAGATVGSTSFDQEKEVKTPSANRPLCVG